jgi:hypothetical protein
MEELKDRRTQIQQQICQAIAQIVAPDFVAPDFVAPDSLPQIHCYSIDVKIFL